jgi:hypothetical protein
VLIADLQAYSTWGALAKCSRMLRKYPFLEKFCSSIPPLTAQGLQPNLSPPVHVPHGPSMNSRPALDSQPSTSSSSQKHQTAGATKTKALDVASLLAATHSWAMENSVEGIAASILRVLLQNTGASYGCFAFKDERGLRLRAAGSVDRLQVSCAWATCKRDSSDGGREQPRFIIR